MSEERFDIYDEEMNHLGTATREETHRLGHWHRTFHCWLTRHEGSRQLVRFQQRHADKDTNPGCYDITVAGHLSVGESMQEGVRELEEELGVSAGFHQLVSLGQVREEESGYVKGKLFIDREVSDVFGLHCDIPLTDLRLQPEEVYGVYEAGIEELLALFQGEQEEIVAHGVRLVADNTSSPDHLRLVPSERSIRADQFVPRAVSYYIDVLQKLRSV
ncbi:NUDIX domain-containing protein [Paenibacillus sp. J5C_2022]|uniref:NUDIX hydrolase n=1 Tax=Paenibacillus sp. J5C2022 TaxID=2977129 RepID=UPI0021D21172|nr:NUDIX domain-containing protein [Paenibacillus sp. J5C2022]MCU6713160.1 NUDIX domain-containing protein [Paenibacillus sp. J5C2022]